MQAIGVRPDREGLISPYEAVRKKCRDRHGSQLTFLRKAPSLAMRHAPHSVRPALAISFIHWAKARGHFSSNLTRNIWGEQERLQLFFGFSFTRASRCDPRPRA